MIKTVGNQVESDREVVMKLSEKALESKMEVLRPVLPFCYSQSYDLRIFKVYMIYIYIYIVIECLTVYNNIYLTLIQIQ